MHRFPWQRKGKLGVWVAQFLACLAGQLTPMEGLVSRLESPNHRAISWDCNQVGARAWQKGEVLSQPPRMPRMHAPNNNGKQHRGSGPTTEYSAVVQQVMKSKEMENRK